MFDVGWSEAGQDELAQSRQKRQIRPEVRLSVCVASRASVTEWWLRLPLLPTIIGACDAGRESSGDRTMRQRPKCGDETDDSREP